jgi:hypothetical protein
MQTSDISENPAAVIYIRRHCRVTEPVARTISELAGFRPAVPTERIIERALARPALIKQQGARP